MANKYERKMLPYSNILGMLCHADSRIFWHTHVPNNQILKLIRRKKCYLTNHTSSTCYVGI